VPLPRRRFLRIAAGAAGAAALSRAASAQAFPARPVHLVVGFPPGQTGDISARLIGAHLADHLGQPFIIDNKPGAASTIATELVVHAAPDGYTLLWTVASNFINATLYPKLPYVFSRDIEPIASTTRTPLVLEVHPSLPVKTVPEFIAYAKANPGKLTMASGGIGNSTHMAGELFQMMTDTKLLHVPYRGSAPAVIDLVGGQVQVMFDIMGSSIAQINAGKLRVLAVTTAGPVAALPGVPTVAQSVPGYEASAVGGMGAPKGTPRDVILKLNAAIQAALADPTLEARYATFASVPVPGSPEDFGKLIASETEKWGKVVKFAGIKPDNKD
jgi:tripartite-type tricarboxylate transporter receptor subunit TctC